MIKVNDYVLLKTESIKQDMVNNSGLNIEDLETWDREQSNLAIARLNDIGIDSPFIDSHPIDSHPYARLIQKTKVSRGYHLIKSSKQGFNKKMHLLIVYCSIGIKEDNKLWLHVSISGNKMPSYDDLCLAKKIFIGDNRDAIQIFPKIENHVNHHHCCLHLWSCLEGHPLPEFSNFGTI
jgi:hypothetical protein